MVRHFRIAAMIVACALTGSVVPAFAQTKPAPKTAKPVAKPAPAKPAPAKPVAAPEPPPPPPTDVRFKTTYTAGDQPTESATFIQGSRERYEFGDTILLKQRDQQRTIQINRAANTYLITPDPTAGADAPGSTPPGVVAVSVSVVDLGERKPMFGQEARRVRTVIERQPQPGACDQSKTRIDTEGWYIDLPKALATPVTDPAPPASGGCQDNIETTESGDKSVLGFPISYRTTITDLEKKDAAPTVVSMEVKDFEIVKLEPSLFDVPAGMTEAATPQALARAVSDVNEVKLAQAAPGSDVYPEKKPGTIRVGVPEVANKSNQSIDTRELRSRLIAELAEQKYDAIPLPAGTPAELDARAKQLGVDFLLVSAIDELKVSKPGGLTRIVKNTAGEGARDITEAKLNVQLVPPGSKPRMSKTSTGKDGGINLRTTVKLAKFAGQLYLRMYMGGMYGSSMSAFSQMGLTGMSGSGSGVDRTAGAAMYVMQQAMAGAAMSQEGGQSFDAALDDAVRDVSKDVIDSLKRVTPARK